MIEWGIVIPAFLTGLLVLLTHVPLGQRVLQRNIIFIDLALAQIAGLGLIIASTSGFESHGIGMQVIAVASALLGAFAFYLTEKRWSEIQEAIIGTVFILAATLSLLIVARQPQGAHAISDLLSGQILWVNFSQLWPVGILYAFVLLLWFAPWWPSQRLKFYILFALAVTASVQLVGVFLVFASLILPALAVRNMKSGALLMGYLLGATGYLAGILLSAWWDYPTGPMIVWTLFLVTLVFIVIYNYKNNAV
jgi:zinc/manganese transport system permease protein